MTMIVCPACATRYEVKAVFPPEGRKVRCSKCSHVWVAHPVAAGTVPSPAPPQAAPRPVPPPMPPQPQAPMPQAPMPQPQPPQASVPPAPPPRPEFTASPTPPQPQPPQVEPARAPEWSPPTPQVDADFEVDESLAAQVAEINATAAAPPPLEKKGGIFSRFTRKRSPETPVVTPTDPARTDAALNEAALAEAALADASFGDASFGDEALTDADLVAEAMGEKKPPKPPGAKRFSASPVTIGWGVLALVVALVAGLLLFARDTVVSVLPGASEIYGTAPGGQGLAFEDVRYGWTSEGGQPVLEVQGNVRNVSSDTVTVPTVIIALRDEKGEEISEWTTEVGETELAAGQEAPFLRQIPSPPSNVRSLKVRFAKAE